MNNKAMGLLGLAARARKIVSGEVVLTSIQNHSAKLVVIANDASENTKKKYVDKCTYYNVSEIEWFNGSWNLCEKNSAPVPNWSDSQNLGRIFPVCALWNPVTCPERPASPLLDPPSPQISYQIPDFQFFSDENKKTRTETGKQGMFHSERCV